MMDCETQAERTAVAEYVCDLTAQLAVMAACAEHVDLARLLEMARLEAEGLCGRASDETDAKAGDIAGAQAAPGGSQPENVVLLSALRAARR
jgi:hypothetical protein